MVICGILLTILLRPGTTDDTVRLVESVGFSLPPQKLNDELLEFLSFGLDVCATFRLWRIKQYDELVAFTVDKNSSPDSLPNFGEQLSAQTIKEKKEKEGKNDENYWADE